MSRIRFGALVRGLGACLCVVIFVGLILPPSAVRGSGFGACIMTLRDDVLSLLGMADGEPAPQRVNESGALWTVDSDLADTIVTISHTATTGAETTLVLPKGTRSFDFRLKPVGGGSAAPTATDFVNCGFLSGARNSAVLPGIPLIKDDLDIPELGTTVFFQPPAGAGTLLIKCLYTVSQNPD